MQCQTHNLNQTDLRLTRLAMGFKTRMTAAKTLYSKIIFQKQIELIRKLTKHLKDLILWKEEAAQTILKEANQIFEKE